eukprot:622670-Pyramimonas_sp.AAC.1
MGLRLVSRETLRLKRRPAKEPTCGLWDSRLPSPHQGPPTASTPCLYNTCRDRRAASQLGQTFAPQNPQPPSTTGRGPGPAARAHKPPPGPGQTRHN